MCKVNSSSQGHLLCTCRGFPHCGQEWCVSCIPRTINGMRQKPQMSLKHKHRKHQWSCAQARLAPVHMQYSSCVSVWGSYPAIARMTHQHQAAVPGTCVTLLVTRWLQCGQRTKPGAPLRYSTAMGTGCGWLTTAIGWVCLLLTRGAAPAAIQETDEVIRRREEQVRQRLIHPLDTLLGTPS